MSPLTSACVLNSRKVARAKISCSFASSAASSIAVATAPNTFRVYASEQSVSYFQLHCNCAAGSVLGWLLEDERRVQGIRSRAPGQA